MRIPLFPLPLVLFPEQLLPLHIFEPQYKLMIRRCLDVGQEFGIILATPAGLAVVGCSARVDSVTRTYPDGRMDILARGCRAFQCVQVVNEQPFLEADIEVLSDNNSPNNETEDTVLRALYQHAFQIFFGNVGSYPEPSTTALLAFRLAAELPLEWDFKQKLLEIRSETERRKRLREHLEQIMPLLTELHGRRSKQKGNNSHVN